MVGVTAGYSWFSAGVSPFTVLSYVLVALPCSLFIIAYIRMGGLSTDHRDVSAPFQRKSDDTTLAAVAPWIALLSAAVVLEAVGLLLGGRSTNVPTLSSAVDHLLAFRWERCLLFMAWLFCGGLPLSRLWQSYRVRGS